MGKWFDPWSEDNVSLRLFYELQGLLRTEHSFSIFSQHAYKLYYCPSKLDCPVFLADSVSRDGGVYIGIISVYPAEYEKNQPLRAQYTPMNKIFRLPSEKEMRNGDGLVKICNGQLHFDLETTVTLFSTANKNEWLKLVVKPVK